MTQYNTIQQSTTQHNKIQHNTTQHNTGQHNTIQSKGYMYYTHRQRASIQPPISHWQESNHRRAWRLPLTAEPSFRLQRRKR